jgi:single-strand DNA-binding protein
MNKVILVGRLSQDPEVRYTQTGKAVATFGLAINEGYGENRKTTFINIVAWEKLAEICGNNLLKGRQILVEGRLQTRSYDDKNGQKRYVTEVVMQNMEFLGSRQDGAGQAPSSNYQQRTDGNGGAGSFGSEVLPDEEIPF